MGYSKEKGLETVLFTFNIYSCNKYWVLCCKKHYYVIIYMHTVLVNRKHMKMRLVLNIMKL